MLTMNLKGMDSVASPKGLTSAKKYRIILKFSQLAMPLGANSMTT